MALLAAIAALSGCAGLQEADCGGDWFMIGKRDGRLGAVSQVERYASICSTPVDRARYEEGHRAGSAERPRPPV
jgi:hypothetical protein